MGRDRRGSWVPPRDKNTFYRRAKCVSLEAPLLQLRDCANRLFVQGLAFHRGKSRGLDPAQRLGNESFIHCRSTIWGFLLHSPTPARSDDPRTKPFARFIATSGILIRQRTILTFQIDRRVQAKMPASTASTYSITCCPLSSRSNCIAVLPSNPGKGSDRIHA